MLLLYNRLNKGILHHNKVRNRSYTVYTIYQSITRQTYFISLTFTQTLNLSNIYLFILCKLWKEKLLKYWQYWSEQVHTWSGLNVCELVQSVLWMQSHVEYHSTNTCPKTRSIILLLIKPFLYLYGHCISLCDIFSSMHNKSICFSANIPIIHITNLSFLTFWNYQY